MRLNLNRYDTSSGRIRPLLIAIHLRLGPAFRGQIAPSFRNHNLGFHVALVRTNR